jgi:hypothetical protein
VREKDVEAYLVHRVHAAGGEVRKVVFPGHVGAPDRLVLLPARPLTWVELKSPTGQLRPAQIREHARLRAFGQEVVVIRSKGAVDAWLTLNS